MIVEMNRRIRLTVIILMFFSTLLNSALTYANFNKAPEGYSQSVIATSRTIPVPDNYTTIQEAINKANEGDTIFVRAGIYYEHIKIDKSLTLVGENRNTTVIDGNRTGIVVYAIANNITLSSFTIQNGALGIWFSHSNNNILIDNIASNNTRGIYFSGSSNNAFIDNIASNNQYGIYLDGSRYNTLTGNNVSSNDNGGISLFHSGSNVISGNTALNNRYGIYLTDSDSNFISGNTALNNRYGICLGYSHHNILTGITALNNRYGIYLYFSRDNIIYHNNFIKNTEPASGIDSVNSWDKEAEGNYWSDYDHDDTNWDGIGDTPYSIYENNQDNYPLMATFSQFTIAKKNQCYKIEAISNSTISNLQYRYDPDNKINAVSFKVSSTEGKGFCRISIAHALIEPPYTVTVDQNSTLHFGIVHKNGTHTWLHFEYEPPEHEITVMQTPYPEQLVLSRWAILGLTVIIIILLSISINYHRKLNKQKKVIEVYERELRSFPVSHSERARLLFIKDVIERKEKIGKFKKKYGIKIQPADTLEDLMEKMGVKKGQN